MKPEIRNILGNLKREMSQSECGHSFVILRDVTTIAGALTKHDDDVSGVFIDSDQCIGDPGCDSGWCGDLLSSAGQEVPKNK